MELKLVIISVSCLSCLAAPVLSTGIWQSKLEAITAVKGAALNGTKTLVTKGSELLADTAAAAITAKGTLLKDLLATKMNAIFAAKGAVIGGAIKAEGALINKIIDIILGPKLPVNKPVAPTDKPHVVVVKPHVKPCRPSRPPTNEIIMEVRPLAPAAESTGCKESSSLGMQKTKSGVVTRVVDTLSPSSVVKSSIVYDVIRAPRVYAVPYVNHHSWNK